MDTWIRVERRTTRLKGRFARRIVIRIVGAWLTARMAPEKLMKHAMILGIVGLVLGLAGVAATWICGARAQVVSDLARRTRDTAALGGRRDLRDPIGEAMSDRVGSAWPWPDSLDALIAAPRHHTLLFENDRVRVLDTHVPAGGMVPVHTHRWPGIGHVLGCGDGVRRDDQGTVLLDTRETPSASGSPTWLWSAPLPPHSLENLGASEIRVVSVELKTEAA